MQQAVGAAPAQVTNEADVRGVVRYGLSLFQADLVGRQVGQRMLPAKAFVQISDISYLVANLSESAWATRGSEKDYVKKVKTSYLCMTEIAQAYATDGFLYLPEIDDKPAGFVEWLESVLLPTTKIEEYGREATRTLTVSELITHLNTLTPPKIPTEYKDWATLAAKVHERVRDHLIGVNEALRRESVAFQAEYAGRKRGEMGISFYTPVMRLRAAECGVTLVEDGVETAAQAPASAGLSPDVAALIESQNRILEQQGRMIEMLASRETVKDTKK